MHDAPPAPIEPPPPPPVDDCSHHHHPHIPPIRPPPDEPPPSYHDTLGYMGAPPGYGTFTPYTDDSSIMSSEADNADRALPEWVGQALVIFIFLSIVYGFWVFINAPDQPSFPGGPG